MLLLRKARQPEREVWSRERLLHARAVALGHAVEFSTAVTYSSHLNSYLNFCKSHNFPVDPTPETLSLFVVYTAHYIRPESVGCYLSGICNTLEPYFPHVRKSRRSALVSRSLAGMIKLRGGSPTKRKRPLSREDLATLVHAHAAPTHDDLLFRAIAFTGFFGLMRLGELMQSDNHLQRSSKKQTRRLSVTISDTSYSLHLPYHKGDRFYEGNTVLITAINQPVLNPIPHMQAYLQSRDALYPLLPALWLTSAGAVPTYSWFVGQLKQILGDDVAGHSLRSGGATDLAIAGVPDSAIQALGRWASDTWRIYVRKHPVIVHALIHGRSPFETSSSSLSTTHSSHPLPSRD